RTPNRQHVPYTTLFRSDPKHKAPGGSAPQTDGPAQQAPQQGVEDLLKLAGRGNRRVAIECRSEQLTDDLPMQLNPSHEAIGCVEDRKSRRLNSSHGSIS